MHIIVVYIFFTLLSTTYSFILFFFTDTATTEIYTLSLHDALPIFDRIASEVDKILASPDIKKILTDRGYEPMGGGTDKRSEEHTSELQSRPHLVCRLLLEKKKI